MLNEIIYTTEATNVEKAHQVCPYSKAIRGNVDVKLVVNQEDVAP